MQGVPTAQQFAARAAADAPAAGSAASSAAGSAAAAAAAAGSAAAAAGSAASAAAGSAAAAAGSAAAAAGSAAAGSTAAAAAAASAHNLVRSAQNWFSDPQFRGKVLVLRPRGQSPTPDLFLFVPVSAQRRLPGMARGQELRPLLVQFQIKGLEKLGKSGNRRFTQAMYAADLDKALDGARLAAFDIVYVLAADNELGFPPGLQTTPARFGANFTAVAAATAQFLQWAPRREGARYGSG
jgi:hypothetical protein